MPWRNTLYKRDTLYDEVWVEPITTVALRYDVSGRALAKMCQRLRVPVPGRGYWAKRAAGQTMRKRPLPKLKPGQPTQQEVSRWLDPITSPSLTGGQRHDLLAAEMSKARPVVAETLNAPHPLVAASIPLLKRFEPAKQKSPPKGCLLIIVRPDLLDRALRVMDALLKAFDARGGRAEVCEVENAQDGSRASITGVHVGGEFVEFGMFEDVDAVPLGSSTSRAVALLSADQRQLAATLSTRRVRVAH